MTAPALVRVFNKGLHTFKHGTGYLKPGSFADVTESVAKTLCGFTQNGVQEVVLGSELPSTSATTADAEVLKALQTDKEVLSKENEELQTRIANLEKLVQDAQASHGKKGKKPAHDPLD